MLWCPCNALWVPWGQLQRTPITKFFRSFKPVSWDKYLKMGDRGAMGNVSPILDSAQSMWGINKQFLIKLPLI